MSVRQSLLAILDQAPCYGYQLRAEFTRRTAAASLNVGQIYNTLERLERDGLVSKDDVDAEGHVYWRITDAGSAAVREWFDSPVERVETTRDELALKVALAATLPGVDVLHLVRAQREASQGRLDELTARYVAVDGGDPASVVAALPLSASLFAAESEVRWLAHVEDRLSGPSSVSLAQGLSSDRPKRGRPARAAVAAR
ncbi:Transcriptional regulator PadR-like family protein [Microbacterium laevaniformans]|uniref:Transcriptional regulator PadR-like family protein n=1 Tax=Microbacterium laevaniformans TaxID=36807 RepID=A0A150H799_9MICO|nr:PadR family transcriptional regulator [Microbacterium laevaniformans]KXZ57510.1 Transcriptional regulator PadR-like family protein [Microbacterium laevaniformans]